VGTLLNHSIVGFVPAKSISGGFLIYLTEVFDAELSVCC